MNNNNNIRTMEFLGVDDWGRSVYKCIENKNIYKDVSLSFEQAQFYSCSNAFDGEPCSAVNSEWEIHFADKTRENNQIEKLNYMLLSRLKSDCDYYLGNGNRNTKHLWADTELEHIEKMKVLYNSFSDSKKPEWLTFDEILNYEHLMNIK